MHKVEAVDWIAVAMNIDFYLWDHEGSNMRGNRRWKREAIESGGKRINSSQGPNSVYVSRTGSRHYPTKKKDVQTLK